VQFPVCAGLDVADFSFGPVQPVANIPKIFDLSFVLTRPLGSASANVQFFLVGRPGLDPGTLGLKGTCRWLLCGDLVAYVFSFQ
jgi:hypothetical protein